MICRTRRLIFVHIPKCGGTSVEDLLWPPGTPRTEEMLWMGFVRPHHNKHQTGGLQHLTARLIREEVGEETFAAAYKFALVRHPLARAVSQFKYMRMRPDLRAFAGLSDDFGFADYLDRIAERTHVQWTPQADFVTDADGTLLVDRVFKLEEVAQDARPLLASLGLPGRRLPRSNTTDEASAPALTAQDEARARAFYRRDFEAFGYD